MKSTRNNVHFALAVLFLIAASVVLFNFLMGTLPRLTEISLLLLFFICALFMARVLSTRVRGLLHSRRIARSLQRDGRRDLDHSYLYGTRMKVGERQ